MWKALGRVLEDSASPTALSEVVQTGDEQSAVVRSRAFRDRLPGVKCQHHLSPAV